MPTEPQLALATAAASAGQGTLANGVTLAANLFAGEVRPADPAGGVPEKAAFFLTGPGSVRPYFVGPAGVKHNDWRPRVQGIVRGDRGDFSGGLTWARAILAALHRATISGYESCLALQAEPEFIGEDDERHPRWSINFELWYTG